VYRRGGVRGRDKASDLGEALKLEQPRMSQAGWFPYVPLCKIKVKAIKYSTLSLKKRETPPPLPFFFNLGKYGRGTKRVRERVFGTLLRLLNRTGSIV
jgi:hypothetical protein